MVRRATRTDGSREHSNAVGRNSDLGGRVLKLGGGISVPYPTPSSSAATRIGKANRRSNTACEVAVRSALHAAGFRFRKGYSIPTGGRPVQADVVFTRARVAVFVDGCFWHSCPLHGRIPKSNLDYWGPKLARNRTRDQEVNLALEGLGWKVVRGVGARASVGRR